MLALISPAKTMRYRRESENESNEYLQPRFLEQTNHILSCMVQYSTVQLSEIFKVSTPLARDLRERFISTFDESVESLPAVDSYDGVVYKHFKADGGFSFYQEQYLQQHLRISSLLYGLLRPFDLIKPYRMEGFVRLASSDERVDRFWRDNQTQELIDDVIEQGGELLYLASREEQNAFHWKEVQRRVRVIDFVFLQVKGDKLRQVVVYTKMARGEMLRYMVDNSINRSEELKAFEWGGYRYNAELSTTDKWVWLME